MIKRVPWFCLIACMAAGCFAMVSVDGFEVGKTDYEAQVTRVRTRAAFDFACPAAELKTTVVQVSTHASPVMVQQFGVSGCGKRGVYVRAPAGWVLNAIDGVPQPQGAAAR